MKNFTNKSLAALALIALSVGLTACSGGCSRCGLVPGDTYVVQYDNIHYELVADNSGCVSFDPGSAQCAQFEIGSVS